MDNKQSTASSSQPLGVCEKLFNALGFRHRSQNAAPPPTATAAAKKNSSLPPPVPLAYQKPVAAAVQSGTDSVAKREKEKEPVAKATPVARRQETRTIEVAGSSSPPATVTRKQTIKEDVDELAERFLKRARLKIRAPSGVVNDGKTST